MRKMQLGKGGRRSWVGLIGLEIARIGSRTSKSEHENVPGNRMLR